MGKQMKRDVALAHIIHQGDDNFPPTSQGL